MKTYLISDGCYYARITAASESKAIDIYIKFNGNILYPQNFYAVRIN